MDEKTKNIGRLFPHSFTLTLKDKSLTPEQLIYAYHSIAHRFVFIFSRHSRPLIQATSALILFPLLVGSWNLVTDIRDVIFNYPGMLSPSSNFKLIIEFGLFVVDCFLTWHIWRVAVFSSQILNAWHLASEQVWSDEWDDSKPFKKANNIYIDVNAQTAKSIADTV